MFNLGKSRSLDYNIIVLLRTKRIKDSSMERITFIKVRSTVHPKIVRPPGLDCRYNTGHPITSINENGLINEKYKSHYDLHDHNHIFVSKFNIESSMSVYEKSLKTVA